MWLCRRNALNSQTTNNYNDRTEQEKNTLCAINQFSIKNMTTRMVLLKKSSNGLIIIFVLCDDGFCARVISLKWK